MPEIKKWTAQNMPDLTGKTAIVTGANSGIGYEMARALAGKGASVIMACRNQEKGEAAKELILREHPKAKIDWLALNLADLKSVRSFVDMFSGSNGQLDILINNAGVMAIPERQLTADGFEMHFGTNHLGHFALTGLLMDAIRRTPGARVVTVSSSGHRQGRMAFDNLGAEKSYIPLIAYAQSKLANLLFAFELHRRFQKVGLEALSMGSHPGWTATNLQQHTWYFRALNPLVAMTPEQGALSSLYAATAKDVQGCDYYGYGGLMDMRGDLKRAKAHERAYDETVAKKLWQVSEEMTGVQYL